MQHAAGQRAGLVDLDLMAEPRQVVGRRQAARAGADHQDALAAGGASIGNGQPSLRRHVAEEALDRVDADRAVELARDCSAVSHG